MTDTLCLKSFKAEDQPDHVTSVTAITVSKVIRKIITKMNFRYQTDVTKRAKKVCLVRKIYSSYSFLNNLTYCNCNYPCHVL